MKRTKIIATLGPATDSEEMLAELIKSGVNVFRLNFSHGAHEEHEALIQKVKKVRKKLDIPVAILADLQGPKIRVGEVSRELKKNEEIIFACDKAAEGEVPVQYKDLYKDVNEGDRLLLDDGHLEVKVTGVRGQKILAKVIIGGPLSSKKGINLPTGTINAEVVTEKDKKDAIFALKHGVDFLALSFVKDAADLKKIQKIIKSSESPQAKIIAKIERHEALANLDEIVAEADAVMVARGDLGIEVAPQEVPIAQKKIVRKCLAAGKPVIVATQMLESMIKNPRATRAETSDIANAILDGADATMLSGETSIGKYPLNAVRAMREVSLNTERWMVEEGVVIGKRIERDLTETPEAVAKASIVLAKETGSKYIIAATASGSNARQVSKYRPHAPIIAVAHDHSVARQLALSWGVSPLVLTYQNNRELVEKINGYLLENKKAKKGDRITVVSGVTKKEIGGTNMIRVHVIS